MPPNGSAVAESVIECNDERLVTQVGVKFLLLPTVEPEFLPLGQSDWLASSDQRLDFWANVGEPFGPSFFC